MKLSQLVHFSRPLYEGLSRRRRPLVDDDRYLVEAIAWLRRAQVEAGGSGVAHSYALKTGWQAAYPETTGYIAKTMLLYAAAYDDHEARTAALAACDWLLTVQQDDGAIVSPLFSAVDGVVFDTGQVMFGLLQAYRATGDDKYLEAAARAGDWLVRVADDSGAWTRNTHLGVPHVYNVRVAWAMLELHALTDQTDHLETARSNIEFALANEDNGWFANCAFNADEMPFTHNLGYATRGLLESHSLVADQTVLDAAIRTADHALSFLRPDGYLPGRIGPGRECQDSFVCLTGNCQFAIIWYQLHRRTGHDRYLAAAENALSYVKSTVNTTTATDALRGAVAGSWPIWGEYARLSYPNWATKFFVDALMERDRPRWHPQERG